MTRLIDADDLKKAFKRSPFVNEVHLYYARQLIRLAPTIRIENHSETTKILSNCHCAKCGSYVAVNEQETNFCPCCGRKVEG